MILFKTLSWKNFLSTGNVATKIRLDSKPTTLVLGANGSGKSTMLDAICYALYKKPFRKIKKDQIINTINGADCEVQVEFSIGTNEYVVRRGIKPDFFEILINGSPRLKEAATKDDQAFLEEDILKVNYESFTQVVILGNAAYTPFMQLATPKRREFIEHILDIGVFSTMNDVLKTKQSAIKGQLESLVKEIAMQQEKVKLVEGFITKLEDDRKKLTTNTQAQIDEQNNTIDYLAPLIEQLQADIKALNAEIASQSTKLNEQINKEIEALEEAHAVEIDDLESQVLDSSALENKLRGLAPTKFAIENNRKSAIEAAAFYTDNDSCGTCKQSIHEDFRQEILTEKQSKIDEYTTALEKMDAMVTKIQAQIKEIKDGNAVVKAEITQKNNAHQIKVRKMLTETQAKVKEATSTMQVELEKLTKDLNAHKTEYAGAQQLVRKMLADMRNNTTVDNIDEQINKKESLIKKAAALELQKDEAVETKHFYEVAAVLLKDTGIKAAIIKQYLPMINKLVNKYLIELDFFLSFNIDENFNETFKSRHRDTLQYNNFSEGEKLRIDLALLFAWRDIARMKNSCATNLLILDEVIDGSMDNNGTDFFIKMINGLGESSNVFVISHKQDSSLDKFTDVIRFVKEKNFSQLAVNV